MRQVLSSMRGEVGRLLGTLLEQVVLVLFLLIGAGIPGVALREAINGATSLHWVFGLVVAGIFITLLVGLQAVFWYGMTPNASEALKKYLFLDPARERTGLAERHFGVALGTFLLVLVVYSAIIIMATVSAILHQYTTLVEYDVPSIVGSEQEVREFLASKLFNFYGWHFLDSIPILNLWEVFDVNPPLKSEGFLAGFLVLTFRTIIVGWSFGIIIKWRTFQKEWFSSDEQTPTDS